jgi:SAM-dependent methyltransferase
MMSIKVLSKIYNSSPKEWVGIIRQRFRGTLGSGKVKVLEEELRQRFGYYKTENLSGITPQEFRSYIESKLQMIDAASEGYAESEIDRQRDFSIKFHWGHNHDFGDFYLPGAMGDRHIKLMANFCRLFPISLQDFREKDVFDVGCWTGGTTLLLAALGSRVFAIEEVRKYAQMVSFLAKYFGIEENVKVVSSSIYSCNTEKFYDRFDIIYFPGVLYHLSDPIVALRILYNSCKPCGVILVESACINHEKPFCLFQGSYIYNSGRRETLNRRGWNWFIPSPSALHRMLKEVGFDGIQTHYITGTGRVYAYAKKASQIGMCKAGLSVPNIV